MSILCTNVHAHARYPNLETLSSHFRSSTLPPHLHLNRCFRHPFANPNTRHGSMSIVLNLQILFQAKQWQPKPRAKHQAPSPLSRRYLTALYSVCTVTMSGPARAEARRSFESSGGASQQIIGPGIVELLIILSDWRIGAGIYHLGLRLHEGFV